jgi:hypothetical protein
MAGRRVLLDVRGAHLPAIDGGHLDATDIEQLQRGLQTMAPAIEAVVTRGYVIVEVGEVDFALTDYQPEGMAAAMIGWVSEEFGLASPTMSIRFDKVNNRYDISW